MNHKEHVMACAKEYLAYRKNFHERRKNFCANLGLKQEEEETLLGQMKDIGEYIVLYYFVNQLNEPITVEEVEEALTWL